MNKTLILKLADHIDTLRTSPEAHSKKAARAGQFNMQSFPCCIVGHAEVLFRDFNPGGKEFHHEVGQFATYFDIDFFDAREMVYAFSNHRLREIQPSTASAMLRHYVETGKVNWYAQQEGLS